MAAVTNPNDELMLLERVFLRFGSAETDEQLESMVTKFLPPVLLKLSSTHEEVKKKVIELLTHISKRIKARPNVQLPVKSLLDLYQDPSSNSFIVNFAIIYIKIGFPRLPEAQERQHVYNIIGHLVNKVPTLIQKDLSLIEQFFEALSTEELPDVQTSIRESLLTMCASFTNLDSDLSSKLLSVLTTQMESKNPMARLVVARYLNCVFHATHAESRYLLLLALLLERVFLRFGSAETDEQLESMVTKFLPPVLLKLSSTHEEVKKKVIELLTHISKRIKARPNVQLPVKSLLDLYQDPSSNSFIVNFAIIYIKIGFPRLPGSAQADLIPVLLKALSGKLTAHQDSLLLLVTSALSHMDLSHSKEKQNQPLFDSIRANPSLQKLLFEYLLDVLIMPYGFNFEGTAPQGMSIATYKRVMADGIIDSPETLEKIKVGVIKLVSNKILPEPETFCLYIVAASDTRHNVANDGDLELRRIIGGIDWSNAQLVAPLYTIYLGVKSNEPEKRKLGANIRMRMKILPYLSRCRGPAVIWPTAIQVLFDSLYGENTIPKLKVQALQFGRVIIQQVDANYLKSVGPVLLKSGFLQLLSDNNLEAQERQHVYNIIGHLVNKVPTLIQKDLSLIEQFFEALSTTVLFSSTVEFLSHSQPLLMSAACSAIGQIGRVMPLPFPNEATKDLANPGKLDVVNKLEEISNSSNITTKIKERAVESLGLLCVSDGFPHRKLVIEKLLTKAKQTKEIEIHLEVGFALVNCVLGPHSPQARDFWAQTEADFKAKHISVDGETLDLLKWVLAEILDTIAPVIHPHSRQASCIWLLTLFKQCNHLEPIIQAAIETFPSLALYTHLLFSTEIIQDFASKGLAVVYESGPEEMKKELVSLLVQQLVEGRKTAAKVTQDTKIFEEGAITTPSGGNLSTYKELCSLASETNQPDLVYKFMHLVNHKAIWDSKKGAAFGFSSIIKSAGEDLSPYLSKIIPKLYRYQFDPVPKIQTSMASIWSAIVPETTKTIDLYHKEIFSDLIYNLTSGQWRVRLSCCVALADFLRGGGAKVFDDCVPQFAELWRQVFRVMDDVHEGTRHAAVTTGKTLSTICVRHLEVGGKAGLVLVETILPVILDQGVYSSVQEVVKVSLETISKIVGTCGNVLKPHLTKLIPALLQATGELESPALNYLSVRSGTDSNRQEVIDSVRASAAKSHYTTETVTRCVQYVTEDILAEMLPRLIELLGANIGLGAKVATAHFFVLLSHQMQPAELQPYSGKMLRVLLSGLTDRNSTLRKTYAQTIGHVVRSAKDASVDKLFEKLNTSYLEKEDEGVRTAIGQTLQAICRQNQELVRARPDTIVPLVFFAMHMKKNKDDPQSMAHAEMWEDVWHEVAPGTEIMLNRHIESVCSLLAQTLQSPSWNMKAQAARAICTVASKVGNNMEDNHFMSLVNILVSGLTGRTWEGKEYLLDALAILCKNSKNLTSSVDMDVVTDAVLKECAKEQNLVYRQKALKALGQILQALEKDRFSQVYDLVQSILSKKYQEQVALQCVQYMNNNTRQVQVSVMVALYSYVDKLLLLTQPPSEEQSKVLSYVHQALDCAFSVGKHTRLRKESLSVLALTLKKLRENKNQAAYSTFSQLFDKHSDELSKDTSPEVKSR
ncbi:proteasome adapter and scaffold protein ECM29, partial [Diaphorina citri]|uniref:Proteasome adapter and scaffold protein ECM29 n=1 Tax=Diaphorina citri TaxID=121845 RepID=A0A3Q0IXH6_DIACI